MNDNEYMRNGITQMLKDEFPCFEYKGHGANIGVWETTDFQHLEKPFGDSYTLAKFRIYVFIPIGYGTSIKIEIFIPSVGDWETVFEGYVSSVVNLPEILNFQLGISKAAG